MPYLSRGFIPTDSELGLGSRQLFVPSNSRYIAWGCWNEHGGPGGWVTHINCSIPTRKCPRDLHLCLSLHPQELILDLYLRPGLILEIPWSLPPPPTTIGLFAQIHFVGGIVNTVASSLVLPHPQGGGGEEIHTAQTLVFTRKKFTPFKQLKSALLSMLASSRSSTNAFAEMYAAISGRGEQGGSRIEKKDLGSIFFFPRLWVD